MSDVGGVMSDGGKVMSDGGGVVSYEILKKRYGETNTKCVKQP